MKNETDLEIPDLFTEEDFRFLSGMALGWRTSLHPVEVAERANDRFKEIAKTWEKIGGIDCCDENRVAWGTPFEKNDEYVALLAFPQEIKKKECAHEPEHLIKKEASLSRDIDVYSYLDETKCLKCGAKLKAVWTEVDDAKE